MSCRIIGLAIAHTRDSRLNKKAWLTVKKLAMHEIIKEIEFEGSLKKFKLMAPGGAGGGYHIYIDNYYQGSLFFRHGEWVGMLNDKSTLTDAQCKKLGAIIDDNLKTNL